MPSDHIGTIDGLVVANHERIRRFVVPIMNVFRGSGTYGACVDDHKSVWPLFKGEPRLVVNAGSIVFWFDARGDFVAVSVLKCVVDHVVNQRRACAPAAKFGVGFHGLQAAEFTGAAGQSELADPASFHEAAPPGNGAFLSPHPT